MKIVRLQLNTSAEFSSLEFSKEEDFFPWFGLELVGKAKSIPIA